MARPQKPFSTPRRADSKTFQITLNPSCGLPARVCLGWKRASFQKLPPELANYRNPTTKAAAQAAAFALIQYLKNSQIKNTNVRIPTDDISADVWLKKFIKIETSPRTARNSAKNRPPSIDTIETYESYYNAHIKNDPITELKMSELEEDDALQFISRMSIKKIKDGRTMGGTRTFAGVIMFVRMAFQEYRKTHRNWVNPFENIDPPQRNTCIRDALPESDVVKLFMPGVLKDTMELAVCAIMFLSGLRRSEIFALKPECLDWETPKITVKNAWQNFDKKNRMLGPPKGKKERDAPFDPILQEAIKKLWLENGQHEFVFSFSNLHTPGPQWIKGRFRKWLKRAGIELGGRKIVPHSSRHSLASLLEDRGVSLRYIQDLLGHSDLKTTKRYLHSTESTIRKIGEKIADAMIIPTENEIFKVS